MTPHIARDRHTAAKGSLEDGRVTVLMMDPFKNRYDESAEIHRWQLSPGEATILGRELIAGALEASIPGDAGIAEIEISVRLELIQ